MGRKKLEESHPISHASSNRVRVVQRVDGGCWWVEVPGREPIPFDTKDEAMRAVPEYAIPNSEDKWMELPFRVRYEINTKATAMRKWLKARRFQG